MEHIYSDYVGQMGVSLTGADLTRRRANLASWSQKFKFLKFKFSLFKNQHVICFSLLIRS